MKRHYIIFIIFLTIYFLIPSLGSGVKLLAKVFPDEPNMKNNEKLKNTMFKPEFVCPFLTARDLKQCIVVSKNFNKTITTYLEIHSVNFGLIDFTKQLEKYKPTIEQISDEEKIITIQNLNPNEKKRIILDFTRENFYFPFTLEFSKPLLFLVSFLNQELFFSQYCALDAPGPVKKIHFSPNTNTTQLTTQFFSLDVPLTADFTFVSKIQFQLNPFQNIENSVATFKYKVDKNKSINGLHKALSDQKFTLLLVLITLFSFYSEQEFTLLLASIPLFSLLVKRLTEFNFMNYSEKFC